MAYAKVVAIASIAIILSSLTLLTTPNAAAADSTFQAIPTGGKIIPSSTPLTLSSSANPARANSNLIISGELAGIIENSSSALINIEYTKDQKAWFPISEVTPNNNGSFSTEFTFTSGGTYVLRATYGNQMVTYSQTVADRIVDLKGDEDGADIQSAIDSLPSTDGIVYIKSGLYELNGKTIVVRSGVTLIGEGIDKTTIRLYPTKHTSSMSIEYAITSKTAIHNLTLENFTVIQNAEPVNHHGGIFLGTSTLTLQYET
jgi:hypothetical protein